MSAPKETSRTDAPQCPHCGYVDDEPWEYGESDTEFECASCERDSRLGVRVTWRYTVTPVVL